MINISSNNDGELLIFDVVGPSDYNDIVSAIINNYPLAKKYVLWDFADSDLTRLSNEQINRVATVVSKHATHEKTAYVGNSDLEYGLLNMYRSFAVISGVVPQPSVFRNTEDAMAWLYS